MFLQNSNIRKIILIFLDLILILFSIFFALLSGSEKITVENFLYFKWLFAVAPLVGLSVYLSSGQYKSITRYIGNTDFYRICIRNTLICFFTFLIGKVSNQPIPTLNNIFLIWILFNTFIIPTKFILKDLTFFLIRLKNKKSKIKVAIYGAGSAGSQLADSINYQGNYEIISFIDDDRSLIKRTIKGIKIISPDDIISLKGKIDYLLLAIPSLSFNRYKNIISSLYKYNFKILRVPSLEDLTSGRSKINALRPISIEELLSRENINPKKNLLSQKIIGEIICVTGAAGTIGSELSMQLLKLKPKKLVLIDHNENGLYNLQQNIIKLNNFKIDIVIALGNCTNQKFIQDILKENKVNILFHAAAYKHVPLVEFNPIQGILNNVFSTKALCEAAKKADLKQLVLVSSDKAVRPTNIMGATKRLSELIIQAFAKKEENNQEKTLFSMVRFGNVLDSSGSVVPLFKKQIAEGGPITLTHEKVQRYFMTISEATELLLQTVSLAKGGDVFLLDMGQPVLIKNLALQMIKLSGLTLKNKENPNGDIEIICTGLRSGEKLYEELLINGKSIPTAHPLIFKANESFIEPDQLFTLLEKMFKKIKNNEKEEVLSLLKNIVPEWERSLLHK